MGMMQQGTSGLQDHRVTTDGPGAVALRGRHMLSARRPGGSHPQPSTTQIDPPAWI